MIRCLNQHIYSLAELIDELAIAVISLNAAKPLYAVVYMKL